MSFQPRFTMTNTILNNLMGIAEAVTRMKYSGKETLHLRRINRLRSLHSSLAIEGNSLSLDEVTAVVDGIEIDGLDDDIKEVKNAYAAYEKMESVDPFSIDCLLSVHKTMMNGLIKNAGSFRKGKEGIFDGEGNCIHLALHPWDVLKLIGDLFQWIKESDCPMILKSCIFHYQFEYIHPFEDGNGRMGRLWQTILLSKYDRFFEWVPVESMIRSYQNEYYDAIAKSNSECDCTVFIEFMTRMILETLNDSIEKQLKETVGVADTMTVNEMRLYSMIRDGHFKNIKQAAEMMKVSVPTLNRCLKSLKDNGAIRKIGNKRTGRWIIVSDEMTIDVTDA